MSTYIWRPTVETVTARWAALERDWQSVVIGAGIVALVWTLEVQIPW